MLSQDDKIWLDTIAGKDVPKDANSDTVDEAKALREAIHAEQQLQKLMSRISPPSKEITFMEKVYQWWKSNTMIPILAPLVVVVSVVGIIINISLTPEPENSQIRGKNQGVQEVEYSQKIEKIYDKPKQKAEQLKQDFVAAGAIVELTVIIKEQSYQLDIEMPTSASDKLRQLCDLIGINPKNKSVRIIVKLPE